MAALDPSLFTVSEYDERLAEATGYSSYSYWRSTFRAFWNNKVARGLFLALCLLILFTLIQPYLPNQKDPARIFDNESGAVMRNVAPNDEFWFGTNSGIRYLTPEGRLVFPDGLAGLGADKISVVKMLCDSAGRI